MSMISISTINKFTLPFIKSKGRMIDYYLVANLISEIAHQFDEQILNELEKFQNNDGGFGNALEADVQAPISSVLGCHKAIEIFAEIENCSKKDQMITKMISFLESEFDHETHTFRFLPESALVYPHAVWWNDPSEFGYFNPTPEVLGFLIRYQDQLKHINLDNEVEIMIKAINSKAFQENEKEHSLFSVLKFYRSLEKIQQNQIVDVVSSNIHRHICVDAKQWEFYNPQPYKFFLGPESLKVNEYVDALEENFTFLKNKLTDDLVWWPDWQWFQFDEVFESKAKFEWMGYVTFERLKAFNSFGLLS